MRVAVLALALAGCAPRWGQWHSEGYPEERCRHKYGRTDGVLVINTECETGLRE